MKERAWVWSWIVVMCSAGLLLVGCSDGRDPATSGPEREAVSSDAAAPADLSSEVVQHVPVPPSPELEVDPQSEFAGSQSCQPCHQRFYELWSTSNHGLAMTHFTEEFAQKNLPPQTAPVTIGGTQFRFAMHNGRGVVEEWPVDASDAERELHEIHYAMGGKNIFYFLTPQERGQLQVLPVAYDLRRKEWYDTTASMVRHHPSIADDPLEWQHRRLTFNTSCFSCHVSQLEKNYYLSEDSYQTRWLETGINCETCHGASQKHCEEMAKLRPGDPVPEDIFLVKTGPDDFTHAQTDSMCAPCHAKMHPLTAAFPPGELFFDHYDMATLEDPDFHPDGRDLGENYTYTLYRISECAQSGQMDCMTCHTSSGRLRAKPLERANLCLPCHQEIVDAPEAHAFHKTPKTLAEAGIGEGAWPMPLPDCISCHMPKTEFARMVRHDHSMVSPSPSCDMEFQSPNACNLCHTDQDAQWSDDWVRKWYPRDYQQPLLERARLIAQARKQDWGQGNRMLEFVAQPDNNEVFRASLLRLMGGGLSHSDKWDVYARLVADPSPLVRSAATAGLGNSYSPEYREALLRAAQDDYRAVRVQAGFALSRFDLADLNGTDRRHATEAMAEFESAMQVRPDDSMSHYNLGLLYQNQGREQEAEREYATAVKLWPENVVAMINLSMLYAQQAAAFSEQAGFLMRLGRADEAATYEAQGQMRIQKAEEQLEQAIRADAESAEAHFNLGLLYAETDRPKLAERALRTAVKVGPSFPDPLYNLAILARQAGRKGEAEHYLQEALKLRPDDPKFLYTQAFFLREDGRGDEAAELLRHSIEVAPDALDAYTLLAAMKADAGELDAAVALYDAALAHAQRPDQRQALEMQRAALLERTPRQP
ncbi:MAG: tetratricopeptide repeat protein [Verrucomicrobiota bacterium]|jgi:Flp pilus assembly protein TadD